MQLPLHLPDTIKGTKLVAAGLNLSLLFFIIIYSYSALRLSTGLAFAALTVLKAIVKKAMITPADNDKANIHQLIAIRYGKSCNQLFMKYQPSGRAMMFAMITSLKYCLKNMEFIVELYGLMNLQSKQLQPLD